MKKLFFFFIFSFLILESLPNAKACPYLECANFTESDKIQDCNYIESHGLNEDEEQELFCALWTEGYGFTPWQPREYQIIPPDFSQQAEQIDNSTLILAGRIALFLTLNYIIFSTAKLSFIKKWLNADS